MNPNNVKKMAYSFGDLKIYRDGPIERSQGDGEERIQNSGQISEGDCNSLLNYTNEFSSASLSHRENKGCKELPNLNHFIGKLRKGPSLLGSLMTAPDPVVLSAPPEGFEKKKKVLMRPTEAFTDIKKYKYNMSETKKKEPKFVPYEPYKGCVKPIYETSNVAHKSTTKQQQNLYEDTYVKNTNDPSLESQREYDKLKIIINDFEQERQKWETENNNLQTENEDLKKQLLHSKKDHGVSQQQLSTLSQINSELKKLLVASVGEDVQGRVQCLTEDKARMATMIRKYSEKVDKDYEEKEKMSIQCDVFRSKFLASSVLIDELVCWKSLLLLRFENAKEALKLLLDERNVAHHNSLNSYKHIYQVQEAFDPLHAENPGAFLLDSCDLVSLSVTNARMAETVRDRLLGNLGRAIGVTDLKLPQETRTPGEKLALQTLEEDLDCDGTLAMCAKERSLVNRFHPHTNYERITMNCCAKCNGDIIVI